MGEATTRFFEELDRVGHDDRLEKASGAVRIDLNEGPHTDHWLIVVDRGDVRVTRDVLEADTVLGTSPDMFEEIAAGRDQVIASLLRGDVTVTGDLRFVLQLERCFPGPPDARGPRGPQGNLVGRRR